MSNNSLEKSVKLCVAAWLHLERYTSAYAIGNMLMLSLCRRYSVGLTQKHKSIIKLSGKEVSEIFLLLKFGRSNSFKLQNLKRLLRQTWRREWRA